MWLAVPATTRPTVKTASPTASGLVGPCRSLSRPASTVLNSMAIRNSENDQAYCRRPPICWAAAGKAVATAMVSKATATMVMHRPKVRPLVDSGVGLDADSAVVERAVMPEQHHRPRFRRCPRTHRERCGGEQRRSRVEPAAAANVRTSGSGRRCRGKPAWSGRNEETSMKVLLLGATGYIGSVVMEHLLAKGYQVAALLRGPRPLPTGVEVRTADLSHPDSVRPDLAGDIDAVVHAGAPVGNWDVELASVRSLLSGLNGRRRTFL